MAETFGQREPIEELIARSSLGSPDVLAAIAVNPVDDEPFDEDVA